MRGALPRAPGKPGDGPADAAPRRAARLRALLDSGRTILAPGASRVPLAARLVEEAGFPAV